MARGDLTDEQWQRLEPLLPPQRREGKVGRPYEIDHRTAINGMLWILRTGAPWRDLPERYGPYQSIYDRMVRFKRQGIWEAIFHQVQTEAEAGRLSGDPVDWEGRAADSTTIKAHPHAAGARHQEAKKGALAPAQRVVSRKSSRTKRRVKVVPVVVKDWGEAAAD